MQKLIFLRNGLRDWYIYENSKNYKKTKSYLNIDRKIADYGFILIEDSIKIGAYFEEYIVTTNPCILNLYKTDNSGKYWWNEEKHQFEIYLINQKTGKLENIQEHTDKELRETHSMDKVYLNGGLDIK